MLPLSACSSILASTYINLASCWLLLLYTCCGSVLCQINACCKGQCSMNSAKEWFRQSRPMDYVREWMEIINSVDRSGMFCNILKVSVRNQGFWSIIWPVLPPVFPPMCESPLHQFLQYFLLLSCGRSDCRGSQVFARFNHDPLVLMPGFQ